MKSFGFVFPGQGSQTVGMLADIAAAYPQVEATYAEASSVLGYDLWKLVQQGPSEELDKTVHTQPALLAASFAIWRIITAKNTEKPTLVAGHSLGEYTALVSANAISFSDAIRLVAARGQFMQEAVPAGEGALAALVGLDDAVVRDICEKAALNGEILAPANFNSPGQVVIAGSKIAVERALVLAKEAGVKIAKLLAVSVPSHCELMKPAAKKLSDMLASMNIKTPEFPVLNNVDVMVYSSPDSIRDGLIRQLFMPVRWVETIQTFANSGVSFIAECGPGKVLTGLNKRIEPQLQFTSSNDLATLTNLMATLEN
jgi:[acyl-carrier-protein] S-malonyltransferase